MLRVTLDQREQGFTLVELAIVLVIIGLIIAGVLVGQDMIKAAAIRATIGQIEKYNAAVNTFRSKYNGMPGDLTGAANFGMEARSGADGHGDNDHLIEGCSPQDVVNGPITAGCEATLFWRDLSFAGMIPDSFVTADDTGAAGLVSTTVGLYFPSSKLGRGAYFMVFTADGRNHYNLAHLTGTNGSGAYLKDEDGVTPLEGLAMDDKMDDGRPFTGKVQAIQGAHNDPAEDGIAGISNTCVGDAVYHTVTPELANRPLCQIRFQFN